MADGPIGVVKGLIGPIAGSWHLVDEHADEADIPHHRMDLILRGVPGLKLIRRRP